MCSLLPPALATRVLAAAERHGLIDRLHWGMQVNSASVSGFLRLWALAKLVRWRPKSYRFREEQRAIEAWLDLVVEAARLSGDLALEVAACARLIKGYGDTLKRGIGNYRLIEAGVIRPALAGRMTLARGIDAIASARTAALADPEGDALARCLAEVREPRDLPIAAE
jgi:indolepyruvate ferredoxin oxidoreductase beta subunit